MLKHFCTGAKKRGRSGCHAGWDSGGGGAKEGYILLITGRIARCWIAEGRSKLRNSEYNSLI